uniref:IS5 family transposase n=1 Tax=Streptomyces sp. TR1341 TaxID=2601266 RepID=UPI001EE43A82
MERGDLSDADWERLRPFLPVSNGRCGRWRDHRQVIDGILHRVRTGAQWCDLPERFGSWKTVYERHRLWSADGTWERLLQPAQAAADAAGEIDWDISVGSTIVRAHQHAVGAAPTRRRLPHQREPKGWNTRTRRRGRAWSPAWWRWCWNRGSGPLAGWVHQRVPECGRPLPAAVPGRHSRSAGGLHSVQAGPGQDPARQPRGRQGLQQRPHPRVPATARHPPHHPWEERQPGGPPAQGLLRWTAARPR